MMFILSLCPTNCYSTSMLRGIEYVFRLKFRLYRVLVNHIQREDISTHWDIVESVCNLCIIPQTENLYCLLRGDM